MFVQTRSMVCLLVSLEKCQSKCSHKEINHMKLTDPLEEAIKRHKLWTTNPHQPLLVPFNFKSRFYCVVHGFTIFEQKERLSFLWWYQCFIWVSFMFGPVSNCIIRGNSLIFCLHTFDTKCFGLQFRGRYFVILGCFLQSCWVRKCARTSSNPYYEMKKNIQAWLLQSNWTMKKTHFTFPCYFPLSFSWPSKIFALFRLVLPPWLQFRSWWLVRCPRHGRQLLVL